MPHSHTWIKAQFLAMHSMSLLDGCVLLYVVMKMAEMDYYKLLSVPPDASVKAIKNAYRKLAIRYHPDKNPDDPAAHDRFQEITEAYLVLLNPIQRLAYDRKHYFKPRHRPKPERKSVWKRFFVLRSKPKLHRAKSKLRRAIPQPKFGQVFGRLFRKPIPHEPEPILPVRGDDLYQEIELTLHEVAEGCRKVIDVAYEEALPEQ